MKPFNLRNLTDELHLKLKIAAATQGKSMEGLIIELLEKGLKEK